MCGFLQPSTPKVDTGAAEREAARIAAEREATAKAEEEAKRQELAKQQSRAKLNNIRTGAVGVVDLGNNKKSLFNDLS